MPTQTPSLAEIFERAMFDRLRETFGGWLPARIESYDTATNRAAIQILLYDDFEDEEGDRKIEAFPVVDDIPVGWLSLGGKFCLRSTISKGDEGIYLTPARPTAKWLQVGGMVDPEDDDHHTLDGGVFLPYRVSVGGSNASAMIEITASTVNIGGTEPLVTRAEFLGHSHNFAATGAVNPTSRPVNTVTATAPTSGSSVTFPGTSKLRG